jgi:hypothetical protein
MQAEQIVQFVNSDILETDRAAIEQILKENIQKYQQAVDILTNAIQSKS